MKLKLLNITLFIAALFFYKKNNAQGTYVPLNYETYNYIDRLEIKTGLYKEMHTSNKPYDRKIMMNYINGIDTGILADDIELSTKDEKNIDYIFEDNMEFDKDEHIERKDRGFLGFLYKHPANFVSVDVPHFTMIVNPVAQLRLGYDIQEKNMKFINTKGIEIRGQVDDYFGFYTNIVSEQGRFPNYVTQYNQEHRVPYGAGYWKEYKTNGYDYFLGSGYVTLSATKHVHFQFGYDKNFIGDGIRSMYLSDVSNNYLFLKVNTNVWKLNYENIFAEMVKYYPHAADTLLGKKFVAMHHLSINATKWLNIGIFESTVFARPNVFELNYLNPLIFYRSVEQALGSPDNAMIGFDFKMNFAKHLQIYGQLLLDEFNFSKEFSSQGKGKFYGITHPKKWWGNKFAAQLGTKYIDAFGVDHLDMQLEMNVARPYTYGHRDVQTTWSNYNSALAHPLGANFTEVIYNLRYQPIQDLILNTRFIYNKIGEDNDTTHWGQNILKSYNLKEQEFGNYIGQGVQAKQFYLNFLATYQPFHNMYVDLEYTYRKKNSQDAKRNLTTNFFNVGLRWTVPYRRYDF